MKSDSNNNHGVSLDCNKAHLMVGLKAQGSVITELMQNCRRSGATHVDVRIDPIGRTLSVADDGHGITDFQNLLTVAGSNWQDGHEDEDPYGVGFLAALLNAERVTVKSSGKALRCDTKAVLAGDTIYPEDGEITKGCVVTLEGIETEKIQYSIKQRGLCAGFPVPVFLNGEEVKRPSADNDTFIDTKIGQVRLQELRLGANVSLYLQGFPLSGVGGGHDSTIVHLDPSTFKGRFPDRTQLLEREDADKRIKEVLNECRRAVLKRQVAKLSPEQFVILYYKAAMNLDRKLLNDVPALPMSCFYAMDGKNHDRPNRYDDALYRYDDALYGEDGSPISKKELLEHPVVVGHEFDDNGTVLAALVKQLGGHIMFPSDFSKLDEGHWLKQHAIVLGDEVMVITPHAGKAHNEEIETDEGGAILIACDSVSISHPQIGEAEIAKAGFYTGNREYRIDGMADLSLLDGDDASELGDGSGAIVMTAADGNVYEEISKYNDGNDCRDEVAQAAARRDIATKYMEVTGGGCEGIAILHLAELLDYELPEALYGKRIVIDCNGRVSVVEVTDTPKQSEAA